MILLGKGWSGVFVDGAADESGEPKEDYRTDYRGDQAADDAACVDAEKTEEPASQDAANYAHNKIYYDAKASAMHQFSGNKSWYDSDKYV